MCIGQSLAISFHTSENLVQSRLLQPTLIKMSGLVVTADFGPNFQRYGWRWPQLCPMGKLYRPYIIIQIVIQLTSKTAQAEQQKRFSDDVKVLVLLSTKVGFCKFLRDRIRTFTFPLVQRWQMSMPMSVRNPSPPSGYAWNH